MLNSDGDGGHEMRMKTFTIRYTALQNLRTEYLFFRWCKVETQVAVNNPFESSMANKSSDDLGKWWCSQTLAHPELMFVWNVALIIQRRNISSIW